MDRKPLAFKQFIDEVAEYGEGIQQIFKLGMTQAEEKYLIENSEFKIPDEALEMLRIANGQSYFCGPVLGFTLLDHHAGLFLTKTMKRSFYGAFVLFEDGCGGYITVSESGVRVYIDENIFKEEDWLKYTFPSMEYLFLHIIDNLKKGKYQIKKDESSDEYLFLINEGRTLVTSVVS